MTNRSRNADLGLRRGSFAPLFLLLAACGGKVASVPGPFSIPIHPAANVAATSTSTPTPTSTPTSTPTKPHFPVVVEGMTPSSDGVPIHYVSRGDGDTAVVFVHCWGCNMHYFDGAMAKVAPKYRVVALDLAGHGMSGTKRAKWNVRSFANDVRAVVEKLGLKHVVLVGHSMSGNITLDATLVMPDKVIGLVPIDTLHDVERKMPPDRRKKFFDEFRKDFAGTTSKLVRSLFPRTTDPTVVDHVLADELKGDPKILIPTLEDNFGYESDEALKKVKVLIICVNADLYPTELEHNKKYAPQFQARILKGVGHWPMFEAPDEFEAAVLGAVDEVMTRK